MLARTFLGIVGRNDDEFDLSHGLGGVAIDGGQITRGEREQPGAPSRVGNAYLKDAVGKTQRPGTFRNCRAADHRPSQQRPLSNRHLPQGAGNNLLEISANRFQNQAPAITRQTRISILAPAKSSTSNGNKAHDGNLILFAVRHIMLEIRDKRTPRRPRGTASVLRVAHLQRHSKSREISGRARNQPRSNRHP